MSVKYAHLNVFSVPDLFLSVIYANLSVEYAQNLIFKRILHSMIYLSTFIINKIIGYIRSTIILSPSNILQL